MVFLSKKEMLLRQIQTDLANELQALDQVTRTAHQEATHAENIAEDAHDTRGLEAAYLAQGQAKRAEELARLLLSFKNLEIRDLKGGSITTPALVRLRYQGQVLSYLLVAEGGGRTVISAGEKIPVISSRSPLGSLLVGQNLGDVIELESKSGIQEYEIVGFE